MKNLSDILYKTGILQVLGPVDKPVSSVVSDSRHAAPGSLFAAIRGLTTDGHRHIAQAMQQGATSVLCEELPPQQNPDVTFVRVKDSASALAMAAANFYDHPTKKFKLIGVTGTNGKTTIANLLCSLFQQLGYPCGLISTVGIMIGNRREDTSHTTPDPVTLNGLFHDMAAAGCEYAFMEVSSHAMVQKRVEGLHFAGGVFTNLTHDHLDYHGGFREYLLAKKAFFDALPASAFCLTNLDDRNGLVMQQNTRAEKKSYSLRAMADYRGRVLESSLEGLQMLIGNHEVWCRLVGRFNAYNILAAYATGHLLGLQEEELLQTLSRLEAAEGRFDHFRLDSGAIAIVDYAHTPDALENVLKTIQDLRRGNERIITVVGCGGNRDKAKRPLMASIAAGYSDKVVLTSDNPRMEEPEAIVEDMKAGIDPTGMRKTLSIINRREAIHAACAMAGKNDILLVAGKGHEKYQEIKGVRHPFDDKQILLEA